MPNHSNTARGYSGGAGAGVPSNATAFARANNNVYQTNTTDESGPHGLGIPE